MSQTKKISVPSTSVETSETAEVKLIASAYGQMIPESLDYRLLKRVLTVQEAIELPAVVDPNAGEFGLLRDTGLKLVISQSFKEKRLNGTETVWIKIRTVQVLNLITSAKTDYGFIFSKDEDRAHWRLGLKGHALRGKEFNNGRDVLEAVFKADGLPVRDVYRKSNSKTNASGVNIGDAIDDLLF